MDIEFCSVDDIVEELRRRDLHFVFAALVPEGNTDVCTNVTVTHGGLAARLGLVHLMQMALNREAEARLKDVE